MRALPLTLLIVVCVYETKRTTKHVKYVNLPPGYTFPQNMPGILRDQYNLPVSPVGGYEAHAQDVFPSMRPGFTAPSFQEAMLSEEAAPLDPSLMSRHLRHAKRRQSMEAMKAEYMSSAPSAAVEAAADASASAGSSPAATSYSAFKEMMAAQSGGYNEGPPKKELPKLPKGAPQVVKQLSQKNNAAPRQQQLAQQGNTYTALGGGQFYQSIFGGKHGFSPLSFFLNGGLGGGGGKGGQAPFFVPVPIVVPPPPPPPPGPKCYTNPSGFLCCNVTLERTMEKAYADFKSEGLSSCNVQKMASAVQEASEKKFGTTFESIAAHKDFVAKINFAGDLNCKIEVDGKFILAYATPLPEKEVNIIDANSFFSGDAEELFEGNGTDPEKPTYIVYGPIRK